MSSNLKAAFSFGFNVLSFVVGGAHKASVLRASDHGKEFSGPRKPLIVSWSPTYRCNLACIHCGAEINNKKKDVSKEKLLSLVDEMADAGTLKVSLSGGETLLYRGITEIIDRCSLKGILTHVTSNGFLVKRMIKALGNLKLLILSIDGNKAINDRIRGPKAYEKFIEAAEVAKENNLPVSAMLTLQRDNIDSLTDVVELTDKLDIPLMINGYITDLDDGRAPVELAPSEAQFAQATRVCRSSKNVLATDDYLSFLKRGEPMKKCFAGIGMCFVGPDAKLYPCAVAASDRENYEGVDLRTHSFQEAFGKLKVYRNKCHNCVPVCVYTYNSLFGLKPSSILQSMKLAFPKLRDLGEAGLGWLRPPATERFEPGATQEPALTTEAKN